MRASAFSCQKETGAIAPNNQAIVIHPPLKTQWYKQPWFIGLCLGNFAGLLLLCGGNPTSRRFFEAAFPYAAFGYYTGDLLDFMGRVLGALIFPAVLTCIAKRFYALWSLLPISLLLLWIVAGNIVSHTLSSYFDPIWSVPEAALLCWVVSSLPLSLCRHLRQRRRRTVAVALSSAPQQRLPQWSGFAALFVPLLALASLGWYNLKHPLQTHFRMHVHWLSGKEARVPLIKDGSQLYIKAWFHDREELCRVDTGAAAVEWPRELHFRGHLTSWHGQGCDVLGGCVATQTIMLPNVRIGGYEVTNLPTDMSDTDSSLFSPPTRPDADKNPTLGNPAFVMTVLTIDYKNAAMIIRPPQYDFTRQHRRAGDRVLEMGWTTTFSDKEWESEFYGVPDVMVAIDDASFWCTLDTGWDGPELGLTKRVVNQHPSIKPARSEMVPFNAPNSSAQVERLHNLNLTIPCLWPPHVKPISLTVDGFVTPTLDSDADGGEGAIGLTLMERYRVTIDYGRGHILLEPYAQDAPEQKQEKAARKAKQTGI